MGSQIVKYLKSTCELSAFTTPVLIIMPLLGKFEYIATFTQKSPYFGGFLTLFCIKFEPKYEYNIT